MNASSLNVYTYYASTALETYDEKPTFRVRVAVSVANSEFIGSVIKAFLNSSVEGLPYIKGSNSWMFGDAPTDREVKEAEEAVGRITQMPPARAFIEREQLLCVIVRYEFEEANVQIAVAVSDEIDW